MLLEKSSRKHKKYVLHYTNDSSEILRKVHFGDNRYQDFTQHKDPGRMRLYRIRHKNDNLHDPYSAGSLSYYILWSSPDLRQGIRNWQKKFNITEPVKITGDL